MKSFNKSIFVYNVTIKPGVQFKHREELTSGEYFMVFTDWTPSISDTKRNEKVTPLSPFGCWYLIMKDLFQGCNGNITCKPDYMREKLSASNEYDQKLALEVIKNAYDKGTAKSGIINRKVRDKAGVQILTGDFPDLGKIIFADNCRHPGIRTHNYGSGKINGEGAYPWAPYLYNYRFINAF